MVIVKQYLPKMPKDTITQQNKLALDAFMNRPDNHQLTNTLLVAVDDLSKSSTGFTSCLYIPQGVGPFWKPQSSDLSPDQQEKKPVEYRTPTECMKEMVCGLTKSPVYTKTFSSVLLIFHFIKIDG